MRVGQIVIASSPPGPLAVQLLSRLEFERESRTFYTIVYETWAALTVLGDLVEVSRVSCSDREVPSVPVLRGPYDGAAIRAALAAQSHLLTTHWP